MAGLGQLTPNHNASHHARSQRRRQQKAKALQRKSGAGGGGVGVVAYTSTRSMEGNALCACFFSTGSSFSSKRTAIHPSNKQTNKRQVTAAQTAEQSRTEHVRHDTHTVGGVHSKFTARRAGGHDLCAEPTIISPKHECVDACSRQWEVVRTRGAVHIPDGCDCFGVGEVCDGPNAIHLMCVGFAVRHCTQRTHNTGESEHRAQGTSVR
jgi:hypothetical protein